MLDSETLEKLQTLKDNLNQNILTGIAPEPRFVRTTRKGHAPEPRGVRGFDARDIARSGPQVQWVNGAYAMVGTVCKREKIDRGEYAGVRRQRQTDLKNRRYQIGSSY